jgi:hypothetical protein
MPMGPAGLPPAAVAPAYGAPGAAGQPPGGPAPTLMPPVTFGPPGDPLGMGPTAGIGPPPGPMYPNPGPYGAPLWQPPPPGSGGGYAGGYNAPRWWFGGDYMLTFVTPQPIHFPLLTTSAPNQLGLLGAPTTIQLVNAEDIRYSGFSAFRLNGGFYGDADRRFGFDISALSTQEADYRRRFTSLQAGFNPTNIPLLARPFIDTNTGAPTSLVLANTDIGAGTATVRTSTEVWGIDPAALWNVYRSDPCSRFQCSTDFLAGYKFLQIREDLSISSVVNLNSVNVVPIVRIGPFGVPVVIGFRITPIPISVGGVITAAPATVSITDRFYVSNRFNGGFIGLRNELRYGMWTLNTTAKLGVGHMHQVLQIDGDTTFVNTATMLAGKSFGGLFANSTNIGKFDNDEFAVIPELTVNVGLNLTRQLSMYVGVTTLYVNRVARPGDQINPVVDPTTIPFSPTYGAGGSVRGSSTLFNQNEYWLYGVNFGMMFRY